MANLMDLQEDVADATTGPSRMLEFGLIANISCIIAVCVEATSLELSWPGAATHTG